MGPVDKISTKNFFKDCAYFHAHDLRLCAGGK